MALKLSKALVNRMLSGKSIIGPQLTGTTYACVHGIPDTITDSGNGFLAEGFRIGDKILITGFTSANNNGIFTLSAVTAGTLTISETSITDEAAGGTVTITSLRGGSFVDIFANGVLDVYSGSQVADAETVEAGTKLARFTVGGGAFTSGVATNGLNFQAASDGTISKTTDIWQATALATGTAGWWRFYPNDVDNHTGADTDDSKIRVDGTFASSGGQINGNTSFVQDAIEIISQFSFTFPVA